jgi:C4-dicarboxylate transporter DctQ subunit
MRNALRWLDLLLEKVAYGFGLIAVATTVLLCLVVSYGVFMRFVLNAPQSWSDELAEYCLLFITFFGLAHTLIAGAHIRIDILTDLLSKGTRFYLEIATWVLGVLFSVLLILGSVSAIENFMERNNHSVAGMDIPLYWPALSMLLGSLLLALVMLSRVVQLCMTGPATMAAASKKTHL